MTGVTSTGATTTTGAGLHARPFGTLLVANRGEIALRVLRAARRAGLRTVAVYSDVDRRARHVEEADTAVRLGPAPAMESYLSVPALLRAAAETGAEAVHPGYGFLSERAEFARAVTDAGLVWVGPPADVIDLMGRKDRAREVAVAAGVPVIPSTDLGAALAAGGVPDLPFPVLVKAAAGGGGKGMRVVRQPDQLAAAAAAARREAASAFGDDTLLLERYVESGRHVEVQVMADSHGTVLHAFERDCSVQRRHQKVVEEAPAPTVSPTLRTRLCDAAVALAGQVGYVGAGTVEFLVAGDDFYFLEMNTRLQVEHPVTEAVTGLDLVRLQLTVAAGERLPLSQEEITLDGHAVEARVYAEDPYSGFLPQAGRVLLVRWPTELARVDAALRSGEDVPTAYDPMLGKVVAHAATRHAALDSLAAALDHTVLLGIPTNVGFVRELVAGPEIARAEVDTGWLDSPAADRYLRRPQVPEAAWGQAARAVLAGQPSGPDAAADHPFGSADGWRLGADPVPARVLLRTAEHTRFVAAADAEDPAFEAFVAADAVQVVHRGQVHRLTRPDAFGAAGRHGGPTDSDVAAPMPGTVLAGGGATGGDGRCRPAAGGPRGDEDGAQPGGAIRRHGVTGRRGAR